MFQKKFRVFLLVCIGILFLTGGVQAYTVKDFYVVYVGPDSIHTT